jgi:hypothetical protein
LHTQINNHKVTADTQTDIVILGDLSLRLLSCIIYGAVLREVRLTAYYLDASASNASDTNAGTSATAPFKTLTAINKIFQPGDTIYIKAGTSYSGSLVIQSSGTATAPITFAKYGTGADPIISTTGQHAISMQSAKYVIVDGIDVASAVAAGVYLDAQSAHDTLRNMTVSGSGYGYELDGSSNDLIVNNYVHDLHMIYNTPGGNDDFGAVAFDIESASNEQISNNTVINAEAPSYDYGTDGGGFAFWRSVSNVTISDNLVENSAGFIENGGLGASDVLSNIQVYNNVSANNGNFSWIHNDLTAPFGETVTGFSATNNTIYEPSAWYIAGFDATVAAGSFAFKNNLVYAPASGQVFSDSGSVDSSNFYQTQVTPSGPGDIAGTISFVNPAAGNFDVMTGAAAAYGAYTDNTLPGRQATPSISVQSGVATSTTPAATPPVPVATEIDIGISESAYQGDAEFTVSVDGKQIGDIFTAHALHATGASELFGLSSSLLPGLHDVNIRFINHAGSTSPSSGRDLYVDSISLNGTLYAGTSSLFSSNSSRDFTVGGSTPSALPSSDSLTLHLSEAAYRGDAQFQVSIDGKVLDTAETVTALHSTGASQEFTYQGNFGSSTHNIGVTFLNDLSGRSPAASRSLFVDAVTFDGHNYAGASLLSNGTAHFTVGG